MHVDSVTSGLRRAKNFRRLFYNGEHSDQDGIVAAGFGADRLKVLLYVHSRIENVEIRIDLIPNLSCGKACAADRNGEASQGLGNSKIPQGHRSQRITIRQSVTAAYAQRRSRSKTSTLRPIPIGGSFFCDGSLRST